MSLDQTFGDTGHQYQQSKCFKKWPKTKANCIFSNITVCWWPKNAAIREIKKSRLRPAHVLKELAQTFAHSCYTYARSRTLHWPMEVTKILRSIMPVPKNPHARHKIAAVTRDHPSVYLYFPSSRLWSALSGIARRELEHIKSFV